MSTIMSPVILRTCKNIYCTLGLLTSKSHYYSTISSKADKKPSTVDLADVAQHSKLSRDEWWNENGPMKALHALNWLRVPFIRDGLVQVPPEQKSAKPLTGKKILDIGCGAGLLSTPLARLGADVTGIDPGREIIRVALEHSKMNPALVENKPNFSCTTVEQHAEHNDNVYDGVVASEVIEHIDNDKKELFIQSCIQVLKPGGRIFFTTPSRTRISQFSSIFFAEYVLNAIPRGTHQYEKFISPNELTFILERNGCHVEAVLGIFYNFLQNKWDWVTPTTLFFALQAVKLHEDPIGLISQTLK